MVFSLKRKFKGIFVNSIMMFLAKRTKIATMIIKNVKNKVIMYIALLMCKKVKFKNILLEFYASQAWQIPHSSLYGEYIDRQFLAEQKTNLII